MPRPKYHFDNLYENVITPNGVYSIHQICDLDCNPGFRITDHTQRVHEITYIVSGSGVMGVNETELTLRPRMAIITRQGDRHRIQASQQEGLRFFCLGFLFQSQRTPQGFEAVKTFFNTPGPFLLTETEDIQEAFISMFDEVLFRDEVADVMLESCLNRIILKIYRQLTRSPHSLYRLGSKNSADAELIYEVVHYIDSHAQEPGLLTTVSSEFCYCYDYLARKFSAVTGESMRHYYLVRRFEKACEYLRSGLNVTAVAEIIGYKSIHAFSNAFKKQVGMPPSEYLRRMYAQEATQEKPL